MCSSLVSHVCVRSLTLVGSSLGRYLFLVIMDSLTTAIPEEAPWCILYAHDIALVSVKMDLRSRTDWLN